MKKIVTLLIIFATTLSLWAQSWEDAVYKDQFLHQPLERYLLKSSTITEDASYSDWDITYNQIELTLNPEVFFVKGSVLFQFKSLTDNLASITIDLSDSLNILSIKKNSTVLKFVRQNDKVIISLSSKLNKGQSDFFTVNYEGVPMTTGFGSFTQNFQPEDSIPSLETLSEPYGAKEWWPCKQSLMDKIDSIDVIVHSPEQYETASNGLLLENSVKDGVRTCHWKHRHPIATYLVFITNTTYEKYTEEAILGDGTKVSIWNYVFPSYLETAKKNTPITADLIELYSKLFIDYPFKDEKYGHAQFSWGGGMEHQTMSSMGVLNASLIAHELAHQWFGDYITCGNWHEIWLNEGFATFLTGLYYENLNPEWWRVWREKVIEKVVSAPDGSVYVEDTTNVNRIFSSRLSYNKAGYVLHILRGQLGDEKFFAGMKSYLTDPRVINGFATTDLFRENMEVAADTSLTEFFNDWIYGEGFPAYEISCFNTGPELLVNVMQTPSAENSPFFEMNIPISIYNNGERKVLWFKNQNERDSFSVSLSAAPDSIRIDDELWLLGTINRNVNSVPYLSHDELRVYFNGNRQQLMVTIPNQSEGLISIFNISGQLLGKYNWEKQNPWLSTADFRTGIYLLNFQSGSKSISTQFVIN